jgi:hypothetical protein
VEWVGLDDGLLAVTESLDSIFDQFAALPVGQIMVNSLFCFPEVERLITRIRAYADEQRLPIEYVVHDFYCLCPSQHLLDYQERYCGVPLELERCHYCMKGNIAAVRRVDISRWREAFSGLLGRTDKVTLFDESALDILDRGLKFDRIKCRIEPSQNLPFASENFIALSDKLHIGILGTMTTVKGASEVSRLASYVLSNGWRVPITVMGRRMCRRSSGERESMCILCPALCLKPTVVLFPRRWRLACRLWHMTLALKVRG